MEQFSTIGVVVKTDAREAGAVGSQLLDTLAAHGCQVLLDDASGDLLGDAHPRLPRDQLVEHCDLVIALGGDGTLLAAGRAVAGGGVPLLGINLGRLGFMVDIRPEDARTTINRMLDGEFSIEERLMLQVQDAGGERAGQIAINDVVVRHRRHVRMLDFATYADQQFISQHRADGIIASTPTGSTAYALSSGGPMLHPNVDAIALVPISPHTLSDRPLIVPAGCELLIEIADADENEALYTCDGQIDCNLDPGARILIRQSPHRLRLVHPPDYDYFGILRNKLNWGRNRTRS